MLVIHLCALFLKDWLPFVPLEPAQSDPMFGLLTHENIGAKSSRAPEYWDIVTLSLAMRMRLYGMRPEALIDLNEIYELHFKKLAGWEAGKEVAGLVIAYVGLGFDTTLHLRVIARMRVLAPHSHAHICI